MPTNDFLPFATAGGANVLSQSDWNSLAARLSGYTAGVAQSQQVNKGLRQSAAMAAMIGQFINDYGAVDALDDGNIANLETAFARTLQQGKFLLGIATGTANAWVLTPVPSVVAYALGRPMLVTIPATNTSTTVNANVSTLGNRRVKKSDGTDPAVGDLVSGQMIWCADDGTNIRVLSPLASDTVANITASGTAPQLNFFEMVTAGTQSVATSTTTVVNDFSVSGSKASDASFGSGGIVTIGQKTAGVWSFNMLYNPSQGGGAATTTQAYIYKNGAQYLNVTVNGSFCAQAGVIRVANGDTLSMAVWQNSGGGRANKNNAVTPYTFFNLYQISA